MVELSRIRRAMSTDEKGDVVFKKLGFSHREDKDSSFL